MLSLGLAASFREPLRGALLSQLHKSVLSHFTFKCHDLGEVYLNCVFKQKNPTNFLRVLLPPLKCELPSSLCSVRLEAAKWKFDVRQRLQSLKT